MDIAETESAHIEQRVEATIYVTEPEITSRGNRIRPSTIHCSSESTLTPSEARRLAAALGRSADQAESADALLTPILQQYIRARDELQRTMNEAA